MTGKLSSKTLKTDEMKRRGQCIVITSGKGGVGKTTTTANLGAALAMLGYKVVMIDADIGLRNLDLVLGLENRVVFDLIDVLERKCRSYKQAIIRDKRFNENLYLLPASQTREKEDVDPEKFKALCEEMKSDFDFLLIDCPAGIEHGFKTAVSAADEAIVVTTPDVSSVRDADRVIGLIESMDKPTPRLIVNRVKFKMVKRKDSLSIGDILEILSVPLLGAIPDDEQVIVSTNKGEPVILTDRPAAKAFKRTAKRLLDPTLEFSEDELGESGLRRLFGNLIKLLKKPVL